MSLVFVVMTHLLGIWSDCVHSSVCGAHRDVVHCPIVASAFVVTPYSSSADSPVSAAPCAAGVFASRCRVVGGFFSPGGAYDSVWDSVKPISGNYTFYYFQYHHIVWWYAC